MTKPNEDMAHVKRDIMEALKKSDEKMECYSRKTEERMKDFSRKADDLLEVHDDHKHSWEPDPRYELLHCETS